MTAARPRRRGRPVDRVDRPAAIVDAARRLFAERGFRGSSLRAIATEAGVDPALIHHYFGDKAQLLVATMELPVNPIEKIREATADGPDGLAERLITTFLTAWDPHADVFAAMVRSALADGTHGGPMAHVAQDILGAALADQLSGSDVSLRANLVAAQVLGLATARYVVRLEPLASAPVARVVALCAPALQAIIEGDLAS